MSITADRLIVIGRGRLIAQTSVEELLDGGSRGFVRARSAQHEELAALLTGRGAEVLCQGEDTLRITGVSTELVGELARANGLTLQELSLQQPSLEERYMELTRDSLDYRTTDGAVHS
jgi:ABC-2 type transport system ATP-binding protein